MQLKPNEEIMSASFAVAAVIAIFSSSTPNKADVRASKPGNPIVHKSTKAAAVESLAVVAGIALLAKSPTVYVVGGLTIVVESWLLYAANANNPATGKPAVQSQ
jgi:hypothetical protein